MMNIVITGVGGQGSLLTSKILGSLYMSRGLDVKVNEVHGMSQRGGSVVTMVRAGEKVFSPLVTPGTANLLIGLEITEAARNLFYLAPDGRVVASNRLIPVSQDNKASPAALTGSEIVSIDAHALAKEAGNEKCENTVLLGAVSKFLDFTADEWENAMRLHIKPQHFDVNKKAFTLGQNEGAAVSRP